MTVPTPGPGLEELAAGEIDAIDADTLIRVAELYDTLDPVPSGLVDRIQFGITMDALHAEIAQLQRYGDLVAVRADDATQTQTITFTSATVTTMVTITRTSADRVRVDGWVAPGMPVSVELRVVDNTLSTSADDDGRFVFVDVPRGFGQFLLHPPRETDQSTVITPSIEM
jgi:hypothetical protein